MASHRLPRGRMVEAMKANKKTAKALALTFGHRFSNGVVGWLTASVRLRPLRIEEACSLVPAGSDVDEREAAAWRAQCKRTVLETAEAAYAGSPAGGR